MDEREMLKKITESAQHLDVPDALKPDQVRSMLKERGRKKWNHYKTIAAAACLFLCFGIGGLAFRDHTERQFNAERTQDAAGDSAAVQDAWSLRRAQENDPDTDIAQNSGSEETIDAPAEDAAPVKRLGKMYTLASDYGEVYDVLEKEEDVRMVCSDQAKMESAKDLSSTDTVYGNSDFSSTNLQVEGVDESDYVKTDGRFIYVVQDAQIQVLDVRSQVPAAAGTIQPDLDEDTDRICEMYVADQVLTMIIQTEKTQLQQKQEPGMGKDVQDNGNERAVPEAGDEIKKLADEDVYICTQAVTKVLTYDITDPQKPLLKDTAVQDGWYKTSRKVENRLYLFTEQSLGITEGMLREDAVKDDALQSWLPGVNGKVVSADCIYLPEKGKQGLLIASMDLTDHNKVLDTKLLVSGYAQMYVSRNSVYLYYNDYVNSADKTRIARFALETDGSIRAKAAKTIKGSIMDTFAIHEREGYLQVLTSVTSSDPWENRVYVLDENMETAGKLTGLAKGEQIYSARFTGDIGYFVTYRNTDPLFTVDFSNPKEPKVIGELEVTGFSEYLHFWSDDRLLGIGYETDPDSGEMIGVKLSMFDISNPVKVKEEAKLVMKGTDNCDGMHDYKEVLADPKKNVIAFTTEKYRDNYQKDYRVFSYADGTFISRIERTLASGESYDSSHWRSVYVGDMLYLVNEKKTIAFAMKGSWEESAKLEYGWEESEKTRLTLNN